VGSFNPRLKVLTIEITPNESIAEEGEKCKHGAQGEILPLDRKKR
jgi:hypothetical protein